MFSKVLVANRGEIAIRAFRAAYELGIATVAVFQHEDRNSLHRAKADESYQIGEVGHPVRAYLSVEEVIKVFNENNERVKTLIHELIPRIPNERGCSCGTALQGAIIG